MIIFSHVKFKSGSLVSLEGGGEIPPVCLVLGAHCYKNDLCQLLFVVCCLLFVDLEVVFMVCVVVSQL